MLQIYKSRFNEWRSSRGKLLLVCVLIIPQIIPIVLYLYDYQYGATFLATQLLIVCLYPSIRYISSDMSTLPAFAVICLSYAYQFSIPIFTSDSYITLVSGDQYLDYEDILFALGLSIIGLVALQSGYYYVDNVGLIKQIEPFNLNLKKNRAVIFCITMAVLHVVLSSHEQQVAEQLPAFEKIFGILEDQLLVAIGIMSWVVFSNRNSNLFHKAVLSLMIMLQLYRGLSAAFLDSIIAPVCITLIMKWRFTGKIPFGWISLVLAIILFLQPAKSEVRRVTWSADPAVIASMTSFDRVELWIDASSRHWLDTLEGKRSFTDASSDSFRRTDFIHQFAYICSMTPVTIPYQYGTTYSYFLVAFIPRFLWHDKPVTSTNKWYAVSYGITTEQGAEKSNFGISLLAESYVNFGLFGVLGIMFLQGALIRVLERVFTTPKAGPAGMAIYLASIVWLMNGIGSSTEMMFGGIVQTLLFSSILIYIAKERWPLHGRVQGSSTHS